MKTKRNAIEVAQLTKVFTGQKNVHAVDGISFCVPEGQIVGLLGPNGAGKSTTIQMLLGTLAMSSGSICYFGRSLKEQRSSILEQVGFLSGHGRLPWNLTVMENLSVFGRLFGLPWRERRERISALLKRFGASHLRNKLFWHLSSGEATKVMLAKAFLGRPRVVLLDEPTAALDPDVCVEVRSFIKEQRAKEGVSMLYTSHNMNEVTEVCDRVIFMRAGKIIAEDSPQHLARGAAEVKVRFEVCEYADRLREFLRKGRFASREQGTWIEVESAQHQVAALVSRVVELGVRLTDMEIRKPTLEDFFLKISAEGAVPQGGRKSVAVPADGGQSYETS